MLTGWLRTLAVGCLALLTASGASAYSNAVACGNWTVGGINLACAGPTSTPNQVSGSTWPGWAVLSLTPGADVTFDGALFNGVPDGGTGLAISPVETTGNLGLWGSDKVTIKDQAIINGNVFYTNGTYGAPTAKFDNNSTQTTPDNIPPPDTDWTHIATPNGFVGNFTAVVQLWRATLDAVAAATSAAGLSMTAGTPGSILDTATNTSAGYTAANLAANLALTGNITIKADASNCVAVVGDPTTCRVVVNFGGNLDLKNFTLTLDGTGFNGFTNVDFVLNIGGNLVGNNTSSIAVAGGIQWSDVLINVQNKVTITSDLTSPGGDNRFAGILLAGNDVSLTKTQWTGEIIGAANMDFGNGSQVTNPGGLVSMVTLIPEPGTLLLLLLVGTLLAGFHVRRRSGNRRAVQLS